MSMVNHWRNMTQRIFDEINTHDGEELIAYREKNGLDIFPEERAAFKKMRRWGGEQVSMLDDVDIRDAWHQWATKSLYPWEKDGYSSWSHF